MFYKFRSLSSGHIFHPLIHGFKIFSSDFHMHTYPIFGKMVLIMPFNQGGATPFQGMPGRFFIPNGSGILNLSFAFMYTTAYFLCVSFLVLWLLASIIEMFRQK